MVMMMKRTMVVVAGLFVVLLLAMPAMSEQKSVDVDTGGDPFSAGPDTKRPVPAAQPVDTVDAGVMPGPCGVDTQSPVLDGSAYTNYDTIFAHGTSSVTQLPYSDVESDRYAYYGHPISLKAGSQAWICCPLESYYTKTGGIQPMIRYIAVQYASDGMHSGWPKIDKIRLYNGCGFVLEKDVDIGNSGFCQLAIIDLGGYYKFDRGLNIVLVLDNGDSAARSFTVYGYGTRFEW